MGVNEEALPWRPLNREICGLGLWASLEAALQSAITQNISNFNPMAKISNKIGVNDEPLHGRPLNWEIRTHLVCWDGLEATLQTQSRKIFQRYTR